jgi:hypothetical protein
MWRYTALVFLTAAFASVQAGDHSVPQFAGCYEIVSLTWSPPDNTIKLIPKQFELLSTARGPGVFDMHSLPRKPEPSFENLWAWTPKGHDKVWISFSTGFGGFDGTLKKSGDGQLAGKLKEWCDYRCGWHKRTGTLHVRSATCAPN